MAIEIQLRSEETGIVFTDTMGKALEIAKKDKTIWKISFFLEGTKPENQIRLIRDEQDQWILQPMWFSELSAESSKNTGQE